MRVIAGGLHLIELHGLGVDDSADGLRKTWGSNATGGLCNP